MTPFHAPHADDRSTRIAYLIGMPRAGTTFLYRNLQKHPQVFVPYRRKTNYFSLHADKGPDWFLDHFSEMTVGQNGIDTETLCFLNPDLPSLERIAEFNPHARAMLVVRPPGAWAWSMYRQIATFDDHLPSFETWLDGGYVLTEDGHQVRIHISDGHFRDTFDRAKRLFAGRLLVMDFALIGDAPLKVLREIETFLGLSSHFTDSNFDNRVINAADRVHVPWLVRLQRSPHLLAWLGRLPPAWVRVLRAQYDSMTAGRSNRTQARAGATTGSSDRDAIALATTRLAGDEAFVATLFASSQVLRL